MKPMITKRELAAQQLHRQAVATFARLAAKRIVQAKLRDQGIRVSLVRPAEIMEQARDYLDTHPELYQQALERTKRMTADGVFGKRQQAWLAQSTNA